MPRLIWKGGVTLRALTDSEGTPDHPFGDFSVCVAFDASEAVVTVRGDVDIVTGAAFRAALDSLADSGHERVTLDLAELSFLGASGLNAMTAVANRLNNTGRALAVRSAPAPTLRLIHILGLTSHFEIVEATPPSRGLGAEQAPGDDSRAVASSEADISSGLARIGSLPASNAVIDAALRLVTELAKATITGADGVSVSLERHGRLSTVAATNGTVLEMDAHQYETGEGPCISAAAEGHWFHSESLERETRWPTFVPLAIEEGIASILSTPLVPTERPLGALNIYSNSEHAFGTPQQELAALFATQASGILADAGAEASDDQVRDRIAEALRSRAVIAHAEGVLIGRLHLTAEAASLVLYRGARSEEQTVEQHAASIVASAREHPGPIE